MKAYQYYRVLITSHERASIVLKIGERLESEEIRSFANRVLAISSLSLVKIVDIPKKVMERMPPDTLAAPMPDKPVPAEEMPVLVFKPEDDHDEQLSLSSRRRRMRDECLLLVVAARQEVARKIFRIMDVTPPSADTKKAAVLEFSIRFEVPVWLTRRAEKGELTTPVQFWVHGGFYKGFYLDGRYFHNTMTTTGGLKELLRAVDVVKALLVKGGNLTVDGTERRCSLRISAPSEAIIDKLYASQHTIGIDLAASTCYLIRHLSEMRDVLLMLLSGESGSGSSRYPPLHPEKIRKVVNLTQPVSYI